MLRREPPYYQTSIITKDHLNHDVNESYITTTKDPPLSNVVRLATLMNDNVRGHGSTLNGEVT